MLACSFSQLVSGSGTRRVFTRKLLLNLHTPIESSHSSIEPPIFLLFLLVSLEDRSVEKRRKVRVSISLGTVHLITYPVAACTVGARVFHSVERFTWVCIVPCRISSAKKITVYGARDSESETRRFRNLGRSRG